MFTENDLGDERIKRISEALKTNTSLADFGIWGMAKRVQLYTL